VAYVVFAEELDCDSNLRSRTVETLEQAFLRIAERCGYTYYFGQESEGWKMVLTDTARPDCSPEPILSDYKKPRDAKHDLMMQAVDGRLRGHVAISLEEFMARFSPGGLRSRDHAHAR
jgi:hypothetical protein